MINMSHRCVSVALVATCSLFVAMPSAEEVVEDATAKPANAAENALTITTADGRVIEIDVSLLPEAPTAPVALGHVHDDAAIADAAFLYAWNEIQHSEIQEHQFRDRQVHLRDAWAKDIARRAAARQKALAARDELLAARRQAIEQGLQFDAESEAAYREVLATFKAEQMQSAIVMTDEMIELLAAGKPD